MPGIIDPETLHVDELPTIWSPVQWDLTPEEKAVELEEQATASLLWAADAPEAILRLLLDETAIERIHEPPENFDPEQQGEWDEALITFAFKRPIEMIETERQPEQTRIVYKLGDTGYWEMIVTPTKVTIERV
ncbi:MAG: hypothetical protein ACOYYS_21460 [Chloroflexota bacterium]